MITFELSCGPLLRSVGWLLAGSGMVLAGCGQTSQDGSAAQRPGDGLAGAPGDAGGSGGGGSGGASGAGALGSGGGGAFGAGGTGALGSGGAGSTSLDGGSAPPDGGSPEAGACVGAGSSTLPGVSVRFPAQRCTFTQAEALAGLAFRYEVVVEQPTAGVVSGPQDAGGCGSGPSPGGISVLETVDGGSQHYCVCDVGLCAPAPLTPITLVPGSYPETFLWDGVNWYGPSDTGNPKGAAFPPGVYTVQIRGTGSYGPDGGSVAFEVLGTFQVTLTP